VAAEFLSGQGRSEYSPIPEREGVEVPAARKGTRVLHHHQHRVLCLGAGLGHGQRHKRAEPQTAARKEYRGAITETASASGACSDLRRVDAERLALAHNTNSLLSTTRRTIFGGESRSKGGGSTMSTSAPAAAQIRNLRASGKPDDRTHIREVTEDVSQREEASDGWMGAAPTKPRDHPTSEGGRLTLIHGMACDGPADLDANALGSRSSGPYPVEVNDFTDDRTRQTTARREFCGEHGVAQFDRYAGAVCETSARVQTIAHPPP